VPERIYKLQPNRTIQLRGFNDLGAAAALHSATATGFKVSGIFRDPADFCVLTLYDCDNFYEHPSLKYLPDTNFDGLTLSFNVHYTGLRNLDSPRYPIIDWPYLDVIRADNTPAQIPLFDSNGLVDGTWTAASAQFTIVDKGFQRYDQLTLWYLNLAFDYLVPQLVASYAFTNQGAGYTHWMSVAGTRYSYTEQAGDADVTIAQRLLELVSTSAHVTAERVMNQLDLTVVKSDGRAIQTAASSNTDGYVLYAASAESIAADLAAQCNAVNWKVAGADIPITAKAEGATITFTATKPGVDGNALSMYAVWKDAQLTTDVQFRQFAGGNSDATWHVSIDFRARGIPQVRRMWLTFAPPLSIGAPFTDTEWEAVFSSWTLSGPEDVKKLQVAGPGSLRIDETSGACLYTGKWTPEAGFYHRGYAAGSGTAGNSVTIQYESAVAHDLWIGTSLYGDRGSAGVQIDGGAEIPFDTNLDTGADPAVITRRKVAASVASGAHTVVIRTKDAKPFYFDYLDVVVPSEVPDNLAARTNISPALDYSTDHTYKLPPARILWMFDKLGFGGPVNQYIGVFWWNQRVRTGATIPQATVTFAGDFLYPDQVWLTISGTRIGKSVLPTDTVNTIAQHFACYVNATFVGLWASVKDNVLTLTSQSPTVNFQFDLSAEVEIKSSGNGTATIAGTLKFPNTPDKPLPVGQWMVDPARSPALNRGAREWSADFYNECKARNRELVVASSMELVLPPDQFPARYHNGDAVRTDVGYGSSWWSSQCAFNSAMLAYQQQVFDCVAGMMSAAGLVPNIQFGEYCWWYFASKGSMAFYDPETTAAAQAALGRPLAVFSSPTDDPNVNAGADATFLRNRLRDHVAALVSFIRGKYPNAKFEVLFPYDVNYPVPSGVNNLGGRLLRFVNFPAEWEHQETSGLDRLKMEGLDWGAASRDLDLVRAVMEFPIELGWPLDSIRYMLPVFNGGCPWVSEYRLAKGLRIPVINLWAFDHVCIFGLQATEPAKPARAVRF
jgi:hypothetical protein